MWNPPIALTLEEQKIAARIRKTRKFFVFLREHRHELLDADFQHTLAQSYRPESTGKAPVEVGLLALALLLQAYRNVSDRDAVERTVMDKRWQMVLDCVGAEQPPFSQGTLCNFRTRLMAYKRKRRAASCCAPMGPRRGSSPRGPGTASPSPQRNMGQSSTPGCSKTRGWSIVSG